MTHAPRDGRVDDRGDGRDGDRGLDEQAVLLVAGLADLAVTTIGSAVGTLRGLLRRSDGPDLARDAHQELMARGRLVLDRRAAAPAHLEVLAQHARARQAASGGDV
ncbi:polyprenyl synthetase [Streptomyces griseosporeus]